jgi:UDP-N-acetylglucosamine 1-carboxyvinyltransferase
MLMAHYAVRESPPLRGEIPISTSKNAVLPIMCGALLTSEDVRIDHLPELSDVQTLSTLLAACGSRLKREHDALIITADAPKNPQDEDSVRRMGTAPAVIKLSV